MSTTPSHSGPGDKPTPPRPSSGAKNDWQRPTGTRDWYPVEAARRRYITEMWRNASIRHGFEEIDGPTFEHLDLYTVKSGEGIVSELFSFRREGGEKDFALRPEFTPTLARMYAAKAGSLPKPTKWFSTGPFFRAERPQRGRLREFLQWNVDAIGDNSAGCDADVLVCCIDLLRAVGLTSTDVRVKVCHRGLVASLLRRMGIADEEHSESMSLLDKRDRVDSRDDATIEFISEYRKEAEFERARFHEPGGRAIAAPDRLAMIDAGQDAMHIRELAIELDKLGVREWCEIDPWVVRGLAYYTGMVFEVIVDGERAVAGGGRYDNLIELFGGPPTPAVGFGMGDVVLSLVLQDKGLMPSDAELMGLAGQRPDVFVLSAGQTPEDQEAAAKQVRPLVAALRRGTSSDAKNTGHGLEARATGLHSRHSYKATKNIGKLLKEAADVGARFAVIIESGTEATIKDLKTNQQDQTRTALDQVATALARRLRS